MRHAVLIASVLASLATLPGCIPGIAGCGGPGDHTMAVDGPVTMSLSAPTSDCGVVAKGASYSFEVTDPSAFTLVSDDATVSVRAAELDPTDFQAIGTVSLADPDGVVDLDLTFNADGTLTGTASRGDTLCRVTYTVTGTFQPVYE